MSLVCICLSVVHKYLNFLTIWICKLPLSGFQMFWPLEIFQGVEDVDSPMNATGVESIEKSPAHAESASPSSNVQPSSTAGPLAAPTESASTPASLRMVHVTSFYCIFCCFTIITETLPTLPFCPFIFFVEFCASFLTYVIWQNVLLVSLILLYSSLSYWGFDIYLHPYVIYHTLFYFILFFKFKRILLHGGGGSLARVWWWWGRWEASSQLIVNSELYTCYLNVVTLSGIQVYLSLEHDLESCILWVFRC